ARERIPQEERGREVLYLVRGEQQRALPVDREAQDREEPRVLREEATRIAADVAAVVADAEGRALENGQSSFHDDASSSGRDGRVAARTQGAPISNETWVRPRTPRRAVRRARTAQGFIVKGALRSFSEDVASARLCKGHQHNFVDVGGRPAREGEHDALEDVLRDQRPAERDRPVDPGGRLVVALEAHVRELR